MESSNISDYERALELKQRQITEAEKGLSLKLQQGWRNLRESSEQRNIYLKHSQEVFKEFRKSPIIEKQFSSLECKIVKLRINSKVQHQELAELSGQVRKIKNQRGRLAELLKIGRSLKGNRLENNINEELLALGISKNRPTENIKSEMEVKELGCSDDIKSTIQTELSDENLQISAAIADSQNITKTNLNPEGIIRHGKQATFRESDKEGERRTNHSAPEKRESPNQECKIEIQDSHGDNININLAHSPAGGLQAEVLTSNSPRVKALCADKIAIIRKLKNLGYTDVLLKFGLN